MAQLCAGRPKLRRSAFRGDPTNDTRAFQHREDRERGGGWVGGWEVTTEEGSGAAAVYFFCVSMLKTTSAPAPPPPTKAVFCSIFFPIWEGGGGRRRRVTWRWLACPDLSVALLFRKGVMSPPPLFYMHCETQNSKKGGGVGGAHFLSWHRARNGVIFFSLFFLVTPPALSPHSPTQHERDRT